MQHDPEASEIGARQVDRRTMARNRGNGDRQLMQPPPQPALVKPRNQQRLLVNAVGAEFLRHLCGRRRWKQVGFERQTRRRGFDRRSGEGRHRIECKSRRRWEVAFPSARDCDAAGWRRWPDIAWRASGAATNRTRIGWGRWKMQRSSIDYRMKRCGRMTFIGRRVERPVRDAFASSAFSGLACGRY